MSSEEARKLLGGYATGTLSEAERKALFAASLQDPELFEALADEQALKEMLDDSSCRGELLQSLDDESPDLLAAPSAIRYSLRADRVAAPAPEPPAPPPKKPFWSRWLQPAPIAVALSLALSIGVVTWIRQPTVEREAKIVAQKPAPQQEERKQPETPRVAPARPATRALKDAPARRQTPVKMREEADTAAAPPPAAPPPAASLAKEQEKSVDTLRRDNRVEPQAESATQQQVQAAAPVPPTAQAPRELRLAEAPVSYVVFRRQPQGDWIAVTAETRFQPGDRAKIEIRTARAMTVTLRDVIAGKVLFAETTRAGQLIEVPLQVAFDKGPQTVKLTATAPVGNATSSFRSETAVRAQRAADTREPADFTADIRLNTSPQNLR